MDLVGGIVVYLLIWWMVLFTMLPQGVTHDPEQVNDPSLVTSAPKDPKLLKKFIATTIITAFLWIIIYAVMKFAPIDFYDIAYNMAEEDKVR